MYASGVRFSDAKVAIFTEAQTGYGEIEIDLGMGNIYHICFTSHKENLCRDHLDYATLISRIGQAAIMTDTDVIAFAIMSNHVHLIVISNDTGKFVMKVRVSYTKSFNHKYFRKGQLGENGYFCIALHGHRHILSAISYVLRNPVHHQVCVNPFSYPYSSAHLYFESRINLLKDKTDSQSVMKSRCLINRHISEREKLKFKADGALDPKCFVNIGIVENYYGSYNSLQFHLSRKDFEDWKMEQAKDNVPDDFISLKEIEPFLSEESIRMIEFQSKRKNEEQIISDIELCEIIDRRFVKDKGKRSYIELDADECDYILRYFDQKFGISKNQVSRCLPQV